MRCVADIRSLTLRKKQLFVMKKNDIIPILVVALIFFSSCGGSSGDDSPMVPDADTQAPSVPLNLSTSNATQSAIDIAWDASTDNVGVTGYIVFRDGNELTTVSGTSYTAMSLEPSTAYSFAVAAVDAAGNRSATSSSVNGTTLDPSMQTDQVLVFTKTTGFRHGSIQNGVTTLTNLGATNNFEITQTEDADNFTLTNLQSYRLVVFLNTTGDVLNEEQQTAFENYIQNGGSYMGIHSATDTEFDWAWYGELAGAYFMDHPAIQEATMDVLSTDHPATSHLNTTWTRTDEWYNFRNINPNITVLLNLDESTYTGGSNGNDHPIAWFHEFDGGRSFYTAGGHTEASYDEPDFQQHLLGGILYCLNR